MVHSLILDKIKQFPTPCFMNVKIPFQPEVFQLNDAFVTPSVINKCIDAFEDDKVVKIDFYFPTKDVAIILSDPTHPFKDLAISLYLRKLGVKIFIVYPQLVDENKIQDWLVRLLYPRKLKFLKIDDLDVKIVKELNELHKHFFQENHLHDFNTMHYHKQSFKVIEVMYQNSLVGCVYFIKNQKDEIFLQRIATKIGYAIPWSQILNQLDFEFKSFAHSYFNNIPESSMYAKCMQLEKVDLAFQVIDPQGKLLHRSYITKPKLEEYCLMHGIDPTTINWNLTQETIAQLLGFHIVYYLNYTFKYPGKEIPHKFFINHPILQKLKQIVSDIRQKVHHFHNFLIDLEKENSIGLSTINNKRIITNTNYQQKLITIDLPDEIAHINNTEIIFYCPRCRMKVISKDNHQLKCPYCNITYKHIDDFIPLHIKRRLSFAKQSKEVKDVCIRYIKAWMTTEGILDPETFDVNWETKTLEKWINLYNEYYTHSPYSTTKRIINDVIKSKTNAIFTSLICLRKFRNKKAKREYLRNLKELLFTFYDMDDRMLNTFAKE